MPADPKRVKEIFLEAAELPDEAARAAYLDRACGGDAGLRERVEALLRSHDPNGSFLGTPAAVIPDPDRAATRDFSQEPDTANTRTYGHEGGAVDDEIPLGFLAPATRPDSLGRIGHYEVLQVLGQGGFGIVFRAFDDVLQRVVAVKVLAPQLAATSPARKRFLREARTSAAVRHENVVQVYEVGEAPLPYIAMEFIPGETLQQRLDRIGPIESVEVVRIGRQIAEGLAAAHANDLIHRDIKPGNILLEGGQQKVKITDFGLARAADDASISQSGIIAGTPMYMAPEQAKGDKLDQRADLFSLGSVLYQMAAGRPPFRANSTVAVLKRVAEDTPRDIREITPETPQWLCDIIAKLHEKQPDDRFQSAREVADVLADCEAQLKVGSKLRDFSRIPRSKSPRPGRRKWVAAAAVLLLPAIALAVTELAGVTQLLRKQQPIAVNPNTDPKAEPATPHGAGRFALAFDGNKSQVLIPSLRITEVQPITAEAWAVIEERADQSKKFDLIGNAHQQQGFAMGSFPTGASAREQWAFGIRSTSANRYVQAWQKDPLPHGKLLHLAGVYDGKAEIRFYVNGQLQSRTPALDVKPSVHETRLGVNSTMDCRFVGRLNEVRISKIARYDGDFTPASRWEPDAETIALYPFDEGQGDVLRDSSGNGHDGKIVGATWVKADGSPIESTLPSGSPPPTYKNSIGMEFVIVPKGKSWLGGTKGKIGDREVEIPADFYLGKYEVTQEEWERVIRVNPSHFSRTRGGKDAVKDIADADLKRFPVESVSWDQCQIFVAKLNKMESGTGWVYRLPTEVEWEYACRGGPTVASERLDSDFDFCLAKPTNTLKLEQANFAPEPGKGLQRTCKVGSYEPNPLGLHDMHGNVHELCEDERKGADGTSQRVRRGASWSDSEAHCQAARVYFNPPSSNTHNMGLRLVRVPTGAPSPAAKTPATDADRRAAEYVLSRGGAVRVNGADPLIKAVADLPREPFRLTCLHLWNADGNQVSVTDAGLSVFKDCKNLTEIITYGTPMGAAGLAHFKDCKNLTHLSLEDAAVTDAGLAHFKDCKSLTFLRVTDSPVTDAGLAHFKDCKNLTHLTLATTEVTDAGLAHIAGLDKLAELELASTKVTAKGVEGLKKALPKCKIVWNGAAVEPKPGASAAAVADRKAAEYAVSVGGEVRVDDRDAVVKAAADLPRDPFRLTHVSFRGNQRVTDAGLAAFGDCTRLTSLDLEGAAVGDEGLGHFRGCKDLTGLRLDGTQVGARSLAQLKGYAALTALSVRKTGLTPGDVSDLALALPLCRIEHDGGVIEPTKK